jgi:GTP pyrophosphokinase
VKKSWLNVATTAKATTKIMAMLRKEERENRKKGETMLDEFFEREDIVKNTLAVEKLCKFHEFTKVDNLFIAIGQGKIQLGDADINELKGRDENTGWKKLFKLGKKSKKADDTPQGEEPAKEKIDKKKPILLTEDTIQTKYKLAEGCSPIPGDNVMGFIEDDGSITIHKVECYKAGRLKAGYGKRILAAKWGMHRLLLFPVNIYIQGLDRMGLLSQITQVISHLLNVNIRKFEIEANEGVFEGRIQLYVHDTTDVAAVMDNLKNIPDIKQVARF